MDRKKVVIGMSGGVDSSVAAYLLKKSGYEVIGVTLNHKRDEFLKEEVNTAKRICKFLGITHIEKDIEELFQKEVIDGFIDGYSKGITPSPCVICDERVKFKVLFDIADEIGAYYVATGHYCTIEYNSEFGISLVKVAKDLKKDQSYMLSRLGTDKLSRIIFPLYEYTKTEIREIAQNAGLEVHNKKDSQGICFAKQGYIKFLKEQIGDKIVPGNFVDNNGNIMGQHLGYQLYTIGQRRGLGLKLPRPWFITKIDPLKNEIVLGEYAELKRKRVELIEYKAAVEIEKLKNRTVIGKPRFSSSGALGSVILENDRVYFEYLDENCHNAPGQHLVIYLDGFVVGSGIISF